MTEVLFKAHFGLYWIIQSRGSGRVSGLEDMVAVRGSSAYCSSRSGKRINRWNAWTIISIHNIRSIHLTFNFDAQCLPKVRTANYMHRHSTP
ncbi:hypothetical protein M378DRAFT_159836 [Amanita muscaria Koide BX008]|uniref:Uncharacterized protein n=1 Tax=Amanita muscaria (strain Koide BX008) TaxID=946122 RepID=A0A0C2XEY7_AMAMK|nr:hypothetical protein M378DRAFT_159836 [Amanita muscaria Koide BX008]